MCLFPFLLFVFSVWIRQGVCHKVSVYVWICQGMLSQQTTSFSCVQTWRSSIMVAVMLDRALTAGGACGARRSQAKGLAGLLASKLRYWYLLSCVAVSGPAVSPPMQQSVGSGDARGYLVLSVASIVVAPSAAVFATRSQKEGSSEPKAVYREWARGGGFLFWRKFGNFSWPSCTTHNPPASPGVSTHLHFMGALHCAERSTCC